MRVLEQHLGHELAARAEAAKIEVSDAGHAVIDLRFIEPGLQKPLSEEQQAMALQASVERIVATAREAVRLARIGSDRIDALYCTGGSTGLKSLVAQLAAVFPSAQVIRGDRFASVVSGLAITAQAQVFLLRALGRARRFRQTSTIGCACP